MITANHQLSIQQHSGGGQTEQGHIAILAGNSPVAINDQGQIEVEPQPQAFRAAISLPRQCSDTGLPRRITRCEAETESTDSVPSNAPIVLPDANGYEEPLVEDDFGWPVLTEIMATFKIFHAAIPPLRPPERWAGVWMGIGCMSDIGWPLEFLEMLIGVVTVARGLHSNCKVLIADEHAKTTEADAAKVPARAERLQRDLSKISRNLQLPCEVFLASSLQSNSEYRACLGLADEWQRKFEPGLPAYLKLGMADSAFMALNKQLKVGWSTSAKPTLHEGRHHEPATDLRARALHSGFGGIYTRPGFTLHKNRPQAVPYTELVSPEDRLMLTGGRHDYRFQIERSNRSPKALRCLEQRVGLITTAFELEVAPLDGDTVYEKAESLARMATVGF